MSSSDLTERERSLNNTIQSLLAERYALRQLAIELLSYVKDIAPHNPYGEYRIAEESERRQHLLSQAQIVLYQSAREGT